jgi:hypothetical protein
MPQALTYPGVYVEEVSSGVRTIMGVATSIALFIGWTRKGPLDEATRVFSYADFEREYIVGGEDIPLYHSVRHFFDNGGGDAYIMRLANVAQDGDDPSDDAFAAAAVTAEIAGFVFEANSPGEWAHDYSVQIVSGTNGDNFRLEVLKDSVVVESFENLSVDASDPRHAKTYIDSRSRLLRVKQEATTAPTANAGPEEFANGRDGDELVANPATEGDFEKAVLALFADGTPVDRIDIFNIVCVPELTLADSVDKLAQKCMARRAFLIVDCQEGIAVGDVENTVPKFAAPAANHAAFYYPRVIASDPLKPGSTRAFPPCGYVAGLYARTDARRGVWKAPAGTEAGIAGAVDLELAMSDAENGSLNPKGINCLRTLPVYGNVVWGSRTLDGNDARASEWKYVPVRRLALFLEESLYRGTQWVVFEPNDEPLWAQIRLNINAFMQTLFRQGAFQGSTPREAYFVKCDRTTTTQADINAGRVNIHVGFAPLKPAEFVVLRIQQIAGELAS